MLHSTHSHRKNSPRFRLIVPLSREVTPDEYVAVARWVAGELNIERFDSTTFELNRLMFWPSVSKDAEYYIRKSKGSILDPDWVLSQYKDWTDVTEWPVAADYNAKLKNAADKQEDPESKPGLIGVFCRCYDIHEAIVNFLPERYEPSSIEGRYTFLQGSTASGMITYEDKFAYSHHGTDPISGKLVNAFDLVRLHLYGHLDDNNPASKKSYNKMLDLVQKDDKARQMNAKERLRTAQDDFDAPIPESFHEEEATQSRSLDDDEDDKKWIKLLETDKSGKFLSNATNITIILMRDKEYAGKFAHNEFSSQKEVLGKMPWDRPGLDYPRAYNDDDYDCMVTRIEQVYQISAPGKVRSAVVARMQYNRYHPIRDYIKSIKWDGKTRVDTLLQDYCGADDTIFTREAFRKHLVAAIKRIFEPGCKYDRTLVLTGPQGAGKSTLVSRLGRQWSSDSFYTVRGKEAYEQLNGSWLIEIAELSGIRGSEVEATKNFLSKSDDNYRAAYTRTRLRMPRQCIFWATTNEERFLKDASGNRRFMIIEIAASGIFGNPWDLTADYVDQVWAEAYKLYKKGESLTLSDEAEVLNVAKQEDAKEEDWRVGAITQFLDMRIPKGWNKMLPDERYMQTQIGVTKGKQRMTVSNIELWCEALGYKRRDMKNYHSRELREIMQLVPGWSPATRRIKIRPYGQQRVYERTVGEASGSNDAQGSTEA